jgi:hypothetical protein
MNSPELPALGTFLYTLKKFSSGFKYYGYDVFESKTLDGVVDYSIVILGNHGLPGNKWALQYLSDKFPNCVYICWFFHKIYNEIPFKKFILTGEHHRREPMCTIQQDKDGDHRDDWKLQQTISNYVPLTFSSALLPEQVGTFTRSDTINGCFIGTMYKPDWVDGLQHVVYVTGNNLPEEERIQIFLSSKIAFGFHAHPNVLNNLVVERVFEGMAYGCVVISDNPVASEITDGIVQIATNKSDFLKLYNELLNNPDRLKELQTKGYDWVKQKGLYVHSVKYFLDKIEELRIN